MAKDDGLETLTASQRDALTRDVKRWALELGFQACGITGTDLSVDEANLLQWLAAGYHGEMEYMQRHGTRRTRPGELVSYAYRVVTVRMDYWPEHARDPWEVLGDGDQGYVSRYALGRDYHKTLRGRLKRLAARIDARVQGARHRVFVDSAPVLEKPLARNAGLGWLGKHTNLIDASAGSWFFLGELYTDLPLTVDAPASEHCGTCQSCIDACPTGAIVGPYQLDARRCISYLTIELRDSIPSDLRPLVGNRIYGCDDCQLVCPWNKFARPAREPDFAVRHGLDSPQLCDLLSWTEAQFLHRTEGSAIRRIGYRCWIRNVAVALGNAPPSSGVVNALAARKDDPDELIREHVRWALERQTASDAISR